MDLTDARGEPVFRVSTVAPPGPVGGVTTVSQVTNSGRASTIVGSIEWRSLGHTVFEVGGEERSVNGTTYHWSPYKDCLQLTLGTLDGPQVARSYNRSRSVFGKGHPPYLLVHQAGFADIAEIVLTFVYVRRMDERRKDSQAASGSLV
ncbi:hypothetical protein K488DRAFT_83946 [Vararia minispora EC-137]|uniref:Uncharacterized protein n=1 Tax=Vararia minispora EC-137 TaxID=1314806 RepID=A0ACB8QSQ7_9AGAM|nr:hypothetical protein K488DRAFT_83946 [Vararia minispora EC-137]